MEGFCGPACLEFIAERFGVPVDQPRLAELLGTTKKDGTPHPMMVMGARLMGLEVVEINCTNIIDLAKMKDLGYEIIVNWMDGEDSKNDGHYSVIREIKQETIVLDDPSWGEIREMRMSVFEKQWFDYEGERKIERWALAIRKSCGYFEKPTLLD